MDDDAQLIPLSTDLQFEGEERCERRDAAENRQRVLAAAKALFAEHGVANVHMAQIAEAAGVGKGTLYRRYANKAELCIALMHDQLIEHQTNFLARLHGMQEAGVPYLTRLQDFLDEVVAFTEQHVPLLYEVQYSGQIADLEGDPPFFEWQHMTVTGLLTAAVRAGELPGHTDVRMRVDLLLAPLSASYFRYLRRRYSLEEIQQGMRESVEMMR